MSTVQTSNTIPNVDQRASIPRKERRSATRLAKWVERQIDDGMAVRQPHAVSWIKVLAIMNGVHWFTMKGGALKPLKAGGGYPKTIRAKVPIMRPWYLWQLGRLNENQIGVTATPRVGKNKDSFMLANRAQAIMDNWTNDIHVDEFNDESNQHLLIYGTVGWHRYIDDFTQQVMVTAVPGSQLFPIPADARTPKEMDGLMHVTIKSEAWLEQQDEIFRQTHGQNPPRPMAKLAGSKNVGLSTKSRKLSFNNVITGTSKGASVVSVWMKPSPQAPNGEYMFMVEDQLMRHWVEPEEGVRTPLPGGKIPWEIVYYDKHPDDWWAHGFCESLSAPQQEADRQFSAILRSAAQNRPISFYDMGMIDPKMIGDEESSLVGFRNTSINNSARPVYSIPGAPINADTNSAFGLAVSNAQRAAGFESRIIFGEAEGRTDSGPANSLLNQNALTPLQSVATRIFQGYKRLYPAVLDMLQDAWPVERRVQAAGENNFGRELLIEKSQVPASKDVVLSPTPIVAGGRNSLAQVLFNLRQMPDDRGKPAVADHEFKKSLRMLNMAPPGIEITDPAEQRIRFRIAQLINDGQQPAIMPAGIRVPGQDQRAGDQTQSLENHRLAAELLQEAVLAPEFQLYGQPVQTSLLAELKFHVGFSFGALDQPDRFDDDADNLDSQQAERSLDFAEQDLNSLDGEFAPNGVSLGA